MYNFEWKLQVRVSAVDGSSMGETMMGMTFVPAAGMRIKGLGPGDARSVIDVVTYDMHQNCVLVELGDHDSLGDPAFTLADLKAGYSSAWKWQDEAK